MSLKELKTETIEQATFTLRLEAVANCGVFMFLPGDFIVVLGILMQVLRISPIGDPDAPTAYAVTASVAL